MSMVKGINNFCYSLVTILIAAFVSGCATLTREEIVDKGPFFEVMTTVPKDKYMTCVSQELYDNLKWSIYHSPFMQMQKSLSDDLTEISFAGGQPLIADVFIIQFKSTGKQVSAAAYAHPHGFINQKEQEQIIKTVMESCARQ